MSGGSLIAFLAGVPVGMLTLMSVEVLLMDRAHKRREREAAKGRHPAFRTPPDDNPDFLAGL